MHTYIKHIGLHINIYIHKYIHNHVYRKKSLTSLHRYSNLN